MKDIRWVEAKHNSLKSKSEKRLNKDFPVEVTSLHHPFEYEKRPEGIFLQFGKHKNEEIRRITTKDPRYITWLLKSIISKYVEGLEPPKSDKYLFIEIIALVEKEYMMSRFSSLWKTQFQQDEHAKEGLKELGNKYEKVFCRSFPFCHLISEE